MRLLNRRARLAVEVGRIKRGRRLPVFDGRREEAVVRHVIRANRGPLPSSALRTVFRQILRHSRRLEASK